MKKYLHIVDSKMLLTSIFVGTIVFLMSSVQAHAATTYNFEDDTIGQTPAGVTVTAGTFDVQTDGVLGKSMRAVTQVGVIAAVNFDNFASTTDQSVVWKQAYSNNLGRSGFTLRAQSEDTGVANSTGAKQGYLFHIYDSGSVYIWRVGASSYTSLWNGSLSKAEPRWFKALAMGNELGFYYSNDGTSYTRLASTTDSTYTSGKVQYTAGYGSSVERDYVDDIVITNLAVDVTAPTVSSFSPVDNATSVSTAANLVINFDEAVDAETGTVRIYKSSDDSLVESIDVTSGQVTGGGTASITINPSVTLDEKTAYYVHVDATAFDDTAGNSYVGIANATTWNFTTTDATNPVILVTSPVDNTVGVSVTATLSVTFDEVVTIESGNITILKASDDTTVETIDVTSDQVSGDGTDTISINPSITFDEGTEYYIFIAASAFDDISGNSFAGIVSDTSRWTFTTEGGDEEDVEEVISSGGGISTKQKTLNKIGRHIRNNDLGELKEYVLENKERIRRYYDQGISLPDEVINLLMETTLQSEPLPPSLESVVRDLTLEFEGDDVKALQYILITEQKGPSAAELARVGATGYFGTYTQNALGEYQKLSGITPFVGYFGAITRTQMKTAGITGLWF